MKDFESKYPQGIFLKTTVSISPNINMELSYVSVAGSSFRPNEDTFVRGRDKRGRYYFGVFDGVTQQVPISGLEEIGTAGFYAASFVKETYPKYAHLDVGNSLLEVNSRLRVDQDRYFIDGIPPYFRPATTATVISIDFENNRVDGAHVGDSLAAAKFRSNSYTILTSDLNKKYDDIVIRAMVSASRREGVSLKTAKSFKEIRQVQEDSFKRKVNNPDGSGIGILNGDPNMEQYIQYFSYAIEDIKLLLLGSDGLVSPNYDLTSENDVREFVGRYERGEIYHAIMHRDYLLGADPEWKNFPRLKDYDDATGIGIRLKLLGG